MSSVSVLFPVSACNFANRCISDLDAKTDLSINGVFDAIDNDLQPKIAGLQTDKESMQKQLQDAILKVDAVAKQAAECRNIADKNVLDLEVIIIFSTISPSTFCPPFLSKSLCFMF
jgi:hypothetical protein